MSGERVPADDQEADVMVDERSQEPASLPPRTYRPPRSTCEARPYRAIGATAARSAMFSSRYVRARYAPAPLAERIRRSIY
jgi:hypothetical protein